MEDAVTEEVASKQVPLVAYLVLADGDTHLVGQACDHCGAVFLGRRNACAHCGERAFSERRLASTGKVTSFTIVNRAAPGVPVPFVSAVVELDDGASVLANIVDVEADPEHVRLGMPVRLTSYVAGTDDNGTEAVAFGFLPAD
ncbi:MAG TPA: OB-fold domain-containing protein [Acidimicrobiales bacterium]